MQEQPKKRSHTRTGCAIIAGLVALILVIGALGGDGNEPQPGDKNAANAASLMENEADLSKVVDDEEEALTESSLTGPQRNAVRNAEQYLSMTGFSRAGLIEQLSSEYGSGYSVADATAAVDSLDVDWNEQAVRSARSYLEMTGFSCNGLIEQLSSSAGSKFTKSEATYGAQQAGAC